MKFYRLDNSKVLAWLSCKVCSCQKIIYYSLLYNPVEIFMIYSPFESDTWV